MPAAQFAASVSDIENRRLLLSTRSLVICKMFVAHIPDVCLDSLLLSVFFTELGISKLIDSVSTKIASYVAFLTYCQKA